MLAARPGLSPAAAVASGRAPAAETAAAQRPVPASAVDLETMRAFGAYVASAAAGSISSSSNGIRRASDHRRSSS